ncbi:MAG TPA: GAF domain-containing protein, partial [Urbifossiella sp.]|nr:GAF domain-containing protein [Urbifossiella sp.]
MPGSSLGRLLIVDDEVELLNSLADKLAKQGYETTRFGAPADALAALETRTFDLLLTDLMMPGMDGIALLQAARKLDPYLAGIVMTGQATVQTAVDALKMGAFDYVMKPFTMGAILPALARALEARRLRLENIQLRETVGIYELCNAIAFTLDHQTLLNKVVDAAMQQCEAEEASVMLPTGDGDELYVAVVRGGDRGHLLGERVPMGAGVAGWVARHHEAVTIAGAVVDPRFVPVQPRPDIRCAISMPMLVGGQLVGVLNVNSTRRQCPFTMGQVKALSILANTGAAALKSSRLHLDIRHAEEQYRAIFENASEGILQSTPDGRVLIANPAMARILGYASPADLVARVGDLGRQVYRRPGDRAEMTRRLEADGYVRDGEVEMVRADGGRIWVTITGRAIRDGHGRTVRYETTLGDVTARKTAEQLSAAEHRVAHILATASTLPDALARVVRALGETLDREWCAAWRVDPRDRGIRCAEVWHAGAAEAAAFEAHCRALAFPEGDGLPGRVWATGQPVHSPDLAADPGSPRAAAARAAGFRAALAFPLLVGAEVVGAIELLGRDRGNPTPALLQTLSTAGSQIGQFIERRLAEAELRLRDRAVRAATQGILITDADQPDNPVVYASPGFERMTGYRAADVLGRNCRLLQGKDT